MTIGILTLLGVVVGWRLSQAREDRRFWRLYAALNPPGHINPTPPTMTEIRA